MNRAKFLLATRNAGKLRELRALFAHARIDVTDLTQAGVIEASDEASIESWETFEENALAKAQYFFRRTGIPTFADDSGLAVDVLGGRPGVRSKRFAERTDLHGAALDTANSGALIAALRARDAIPARAAFVCAAAFVNENNALVRLGRTCGVVVAHPSGEHGFGYDPYFMSDELGVTFGDAVTEEKSRISHRARAFGALLDALGRISGDPLHRRGRPA